MIDQIKTKTEELIELLNKQTNIDKSHENPEEHDRICALVVFGHVHKNRQIDCQIAVTGDEDALQAILKNLAKKHPDTGRMIHDGICNANFDNESLTT